MSAQTVGLLHPGASGSTIGRTIVSSGHRLLWASAGRRAGLPGGFHSAAAEVYRSIAGQADESLPIAHERTLTDLLNGPERPSFDPTR